MNSSISNSDPAGDWRAFFRLAIGTALAVGAGLYAFIATVDPWDSLPLSPPLRRAPISHNSRFSFPALARSARFDSVIIGTSTSRLLRPAFLDGKLGASFANLSMNSATPYEQSRLARVFASRHPDAKFVLVGLDFRYCETSGVRKYGPVEFPEWLYDDDLWRRYLHIFSIYGLQEAAAQFGYLTRVWPPRFGFDGYTNFLPDDRAYDAGRAAAHLDHRGPPPDAAPAPIADDLRFNFPGLEDLARLLSALPAATRKVLFFTPTYIGDQNDDATYAACKFRVARMAAATANAVTADFMIPSPITREASHYWDGLHYRIGFADRIALDLVAIAKGQDATNGDFVIRKP